MSIIKGKHIRIKTKRIVYFIINNNALCVQVFVVEPDVILHLLNRTHYEFTLLVALVILVLRVLILWALAPRALLFVAARSTLPMITKPTYSVSCMSWVGVRFLFPISDKCCLVLRHDSVALTCR